jgi:hypothetical protein
MNLYKKLTVQVPSKRSCVCYSRLSGTNWAYVDHVQTQALFLPPSLPPICLQSLTRDIKRAGVGRGMSRCWSSPVSCAPTGFSHSSDPSNMPDPPVISDGSPFSGENTPVGAPEPKMSPPLDNNGAREGRGGGEEGYQGEEMKLGGGGGSRAGERMCYIWNTSSLRKIHRAVALESYPHFFLNSCDYQYTRDP